MDFKYFGTYGELYIECQEINKVIWKFWMNLITSLISTYNYNVTSSFLQDKHTHTHEYVSMTVVNTIQYQHFEDTPMIWLFQSSESTQQSHLWRWCKSIKTHGTILTYLVMVKVKVTIKLSLYRSFWHTRGSGSTALTILNISIRQR